MRRLITLLGILIQRLICLGAGHFPPPDRIKHLRRVGILEEDETVACVHCGKQLT